MKANIYYFSGTGNSLFVAKEIAKKLDGQIIPIGSFLKTKEIKTDALVIGIVFPVYYCELPVIVKEFAKKLIDIKKKYIFSVATYGGAASVSLKNLKNIIKLKGGRIYASYGLHLPQNSFKKPFENHEKLISKSKKKAYMIAKKTRRKAKVLYRDNYILEVIFAPFYPITKPAVKKLLINTSKKTNIFEKDELMRFVDNSFATNDSCTGCGICMKVCPVKNIKIENNRPIWLNHCENCIACFSWCPQKSIYGGITPINYSYHNTQIDISEMMN